MMTAAFLATLAVGSAQAFSPARVELGTSAMEPFSSCGSSCSMMRRQDYDVCKADSATRALPSATAWDHNEGEPTTATRAFLAEVDYVPVDPAVLQVGGVTDRTKRFKFPPPTNYDAALDAAGTGNHAEQAVLELVLNDEEKPSSVVRQNANTNITAAVAVGSALSSPPLPTKLGTSATESFLSSSCSMMRRQDNYAYTRTADSAMCALPSVKASDHNECEPECATASAAVGGVAAAGCFDEFTLVTNYSDSSVIKTGAPNSKTNVAAKTDIAPYYAKFDVGDRANTVYHSKVVVADTAAPVFIQPGLTHQFKEGNALSDPGATCSDTCDQAIAPPVEMWPSFLLNNAGHAGCTETSVVGGTIVWACDKRAQKHGARDGKKVGECTRTYTRTDAAGNTHSSQRKFIVIAYDQPVTTITESHRKCNEIQYQTKATSLLLLGALHFVQTRAKGVGRRARGIEKLVVLLGMLLEAAAAGCTGASAGLTAAQCTAWGKFWDGAGGPSWNGYGQGCTKEDPCGSCPNGVTCSGSSITIMCAPTRCRVPRWRRACQQTRAYPFSSAPTRAPPCASVICPAAICVGQYPTQRVPSWTWISSPCTATPSPVAFLLPYRHGRK